jgi:hypothetical protein
LTAKPAATAPDEHGGAAAMEVRPEEAAEAGTAREADPAATRMSTATVTKTERSQRRVTGCHLLGS